MSSELNKTQSKLHEIIFESNTVGGKLFDIALLGCILLSIIVVMLDSVPSFHLRFGGLFYIIEWGFTILFTIEFILRLIAVRWPLRYAFSFLGLIDLLAIVPMYLSILFTGAQSLACASGFAFIAHFPHF